MQTLQTVQVVSQMCFTVLSLHLAQMNKTVTFCSCTPLAKISFWIQLSLD